MNERSKRRSPLVLGPEAVLPSQFFRNLRMDRQLRTGECQLLVAVMADAVECYKKYNQAEDSFGRRLFRDAEDWIMSPGAQGRPAESDGTAFSFEYCCDILGIDASSVRSILRRWQHNQTGQVEVTELSRRTGGA